MIKSIDDYRKKVLGIRFNGISTEISSNDPISLAFCANSKDFELQKPMVGKILGLFNKRPPIFTECSKNLEEVETLFIFGDLEFGPIKAKKSFSFKSFNTISQSPNLKRELWEKLKKYT